MKLLTATFQFENAEVVFAGDRITVRIRDDGKRWNIVHSFTNKWVNKSKESGGVMGRGYKPRVTDAMLLVGRAKREAANRNKGS